MSDDSESGSPTRVAFNLMQTIAAKEGKPEGTSTRDYYLDLFIECRAAVIRGSRR